MTIKRKACAASSPGDNVFEYVMSDATVDSYGDVIEQRGWDLSNFKKNPIALFNHDKDFPIGTWESVRVDSGRLVGRIKFMEAVSDRLREIQEAVKAGVLRAVSVGFRPIEYQPIKTGIKFIKQELAECSLVSVPANPNALQIMRSLNISQEAQQIIFAKPGDAILRRNVPGVIAKTQKPPILRNTNMTLAEKIEAAETRLLALRDDLSEIVSKSEEGEMEAEDMAMSEELSQKIETHKSTVEALKNAERSLAVKAAGAPRVIDQNGVRVPRIEVKSISPKEHVVRSLVASMVAHVTRQPVMDILKARYGENEQTKMIADMVVRAATAPATTTATGWATELVNTAFGEFMQTLIPDSVYAKLSALGTRYTFGANGKITIPSRNTAVSVAGGFIGEGAPIPVKQGAFVAINLTQKKLGVITTFTREIADHSTPSIEGVLRQAIQDDTSIAVDAALLDATAANSVRPAGLRNGVTGLTATAGGGFTAAVGDLKALIGAMITGSSGMLRLPTFIMNPAQGLSLSMTQNAGGDFPFAADLANKTLVGYPVIMSTNVTAGTVLIVDAADFASVTGDVPLFRVSDQTSLHMEDTSPLAIGTAGAPNVVAAPVRSMFQTDSIALRMTLDMNWAMRRTGLVAFTTSVTW